MKAKTIILALLMTFGVFSSRAYDFSAVAPSGQTLYYNIRTDGTGVNVVWPNASSTLASETWTGYTKPTGDLTIPSSVTYEGMTYSVVSIGTAFFQCTGLTSVTIPNTVTNISVNAFYGCTGLTGALVIPNSVTSIGGFAFGNCSGLSSLTLGNSLTTIAYSAFNRCTGLTGNLTIPNSVTTIGRNAFYYCRGITSLSISNSLTTIDTALFFACTGLTSVVVPSSVKHIKSGAFDSCVNLNSITLGDSVQDVGYMAFGYCGNLASITIPRTVTYIGDYCFSACSNLNDIYMKPLTPPTTEQDSFEDTPYEMLIHLPCNSPISYVSGSAWQGHRCTMDITYDFSVTGDPSGGTVEILQEPTCDNAQAEVQANPYSGFHFINWSDGNTNAHRYILVTCDTAIHANFAEDVTYTVTATSANTSMGSVSGGGSYTAGSTATLTATAYNGYHFSHWQDNNTSNPRTITVTGDATYTACFDYGNGIDDAEATDNIKVYTRGNTIVIEATDALTQSSNNTITVYDVMGRVIKQSADSGQPAAVEIPVTSAGVYMVKVGDHPSRKVLVRP